MTTPDTSPDRATELAKVPITPAGKVIAAATATTPSLSVPLMPPPAALCDGEQRAADGGVEPTPRPSTSQ
jgi:hypothetical protein